MRNTRVLKLWNLLWAGVLLTSVSCSTALAQQTETIAKYIPVLLQGKEIKLPEDFVARLDGNRLKVALKSFGLAERHPDRDLLVSLIQDDGSSVEMRPDANGEMNFENVKEGLISLVVGSGKAAYAAMALYAVPGIAGSPAKAYEVPVATIDEREVRDAVEVAGTAPAGSSATNLTDYATGAVNRFKVYLQPDGALLGQVIVPEAGFERLAASVDLSFFRSGSLVGKTTSSADGSFAIVGLQPGIHSVFASGPPGHAAFAFEVLPPKANNELPFSENSAEDGTRFVATANLQLPGADELIVLIIPPRLMPGVRDVVLSKYPFSASSASGLAGPVPAGAPMGGGAMGGFPGVGGLPGGGLGGGGGFSGGAGGGGGGLGGIGGLLGIAGLAVGVAALADDEDGFNVNVATPINQ
jgi:hypothetical protein